MPCWTAKSGTGIILEMGMKDKIQDDILPLWRELEQLRREEKIEFAYLFGSFAKGGVWTGSDIDLAVYINHKTDTDWIQVQDRILMSTDRDIDIFRFDDEEENPFIALEALEHGIPLVAVDDTNRAVYYEVAERVFNETEDISSHDNALGITCAAAEQAFK